MGLQPTLYEARLKVDHAIVVVGPVPVLDWSSGERPVEADPGEAVCRIAVAVDLDMPVAIVIKGPGNRPGGYVPTTLLPVEDAGLGIVVE